ncbi:hypothetical protein TREES_T100002895 [Tupaia chinensis]|uniref:Uncharacterized protein n=1 Tax=Tupaia chinensis TaxID=246437 RepID=L9KTM7_TUPCH|nr:hypothetical protein TREES_T100002895 [Tupaia chinensis]
MVGREHTDVWIIVMHHDGHHRHLQMECSPNQAFAILSVTKLIQASVSESFRPSPKRLGSLRPGPDSVPNTADCPRAPRPGRAERSRPSPIDFSGLGWALSTTRNA